jgi:hypothetical protein
MMSSMAAVSAMHKEVAQRTEQENQVRQHSQQVGAMFGPQKERRRYQEDHEPSPMSRRAMSFSVMG